MNRTDYALASDSATSPEDLTQLAERSSKMAILALIAAHPNAPGTLLAALWTHPHILIVREQAQNDPNPRDFAGYDASDEDNLYRMEFAIAQHPNTPQDMLMQFAQQARFGGSVARNPSASPQVLEMILRSESHYGGVTIKNIGRHPNTPAAALDIVACLLPVNELDIIKGHLNLSALAREIIAYRQKNATASPAAIELMISQDVYTQILHDPDTSSVALHLIFNRVLKPMNLFYLTQIAQHPNASTETLQAISAAFVNWYLLIQYSDQFNWSYSTAELYAALVNHDNYVLEIGATLNGLGDALPLLQMSHTEKRKLASDPSTSNEMLVLLVRSGDEQVLCSLAHNPSTTLAILEKLLVYRSPMVRDAIARNPNTSGELLRELYKRQNSGNRDYMLIAAHPNTPPDILARFAHYSDPKIQNALKRNPNFQRPSPD